MHSRKIGMGEVGFQAATYMIYTLIAFACAYPFYYILMYSLSDPAKAAGSAGLLYPVGFTLSNFKAILELPNLYNAALVSGARTVVGTAFGTLMTFMFGYVLTQDKLVARKLMYRLTIATIYLNSGLIPWYITMRAYGLKDNFLLYIIPGAISAFNLILVKNFIEQTPYSLQESAHIDGAGHMTVLWKIMFPLCKPVIAAIVIFSAVAQWNSWVDNFYLVQKESLQTLQFLLYNYVREADNLAVSMQSGGRTLGEMAGSSTRITPMSVRMTLTIFVTIPILFVYPLMQRYFIKGIMIGAVKG